MRFRKKHNSCLNCGYPLDKLYNYCPLCGQENTDSYISFKTMTGDFLSNYLALDSRFGRTIKPFFLKPGFLTNEFMAGRRNTYSHPIRIYLVISLIFFGILSTAISHVISKQNEEELIQKSIGLDQIPGLPDSTRTKLSKAMDTRDIESINKKKPEHVDQLKQNLQALPTSDKKEIINALSQSEVDLLTTETVDSLKSNQTLAELFQQKSGKVEKKPEIRFMDDHYFNRIKVLSKNDDFSDTQVVDSLYLKNAGKVELYISKQIVRAYRADDEVMISYIVKNIPLMMLIFIPLSGLILKLLYVRHNIYYLNHLIHSFHIHSFAYLMYGISVILSVYFLSDLWDDIISILFLIILTVYCYLSFLKVYKQDIFKTTVKFILMGVIYSFWISIFFLSEVLISFLIF